MVDLIVDSDSNSVAESTVVSNKVVFTDIDGTLAVHGVVSKRNGKAHQALRASGIQVIPVTARCLENLEHMISENLDCFGGSDINSIVYPCILNNGAIIYDSKGDIFYEGCLESTTVDYLCEKVRAAKISNKYGYISTFGSIRGNAYMQFVDDGIVELFRRFNSKIRVLNHTWEDSMKNGQKITLLSVYIKDEDKMQLFIKDIQDQCGCQVSLSQKYLVDFQGASQSKGAAVELLVKKMNLPMSSVVSIGDGDNDISMLSLRGIHTSVAMGNAADNVKSIAQQSTSSAELDGWAEALEKLIN